MRMAAMSGHVNATDMHHVRMSNDSRVDEARELIMVAKDMGLRRLHVEGTENDGDMELPEQPEDLPSEARDELRRRVGSVWEDVKDARTFMASRRSHRGSIEARLTTRMQAMINGMDYDPVDGTMMPHMELVQEGGQARLLQSHAELIAE
jgi:hypothetical protein